MQEHPREERALREDTEGTGEGQGKGQGRVPREDRV